METKSLLFGLVGFFLGGLLVSIAATTFNKPGQDDISGTNTPMSHMSMNAMTADLEYKTGDEFDQAFIASMIIHHEGAVEMAKLSVKNAKHQEIKTLSENIISAQDKEISEMKQWQSDWGYPTASDHDHMSH